MLNEAKTELAAIITGVTAMFIDFFDFYDAFRLDEEDATRGLGVFNVNARKGNILQDSKSLFKTISTIPISVSAI